MPLKKVHLSRLSPVMRRSGSPYPRREMTVPIQPSLGAMGNYEGNVYDVDPRGTPLWSDVYRIGAAGSLSRVSPFGPSAFGSNGDGASLLDRIRPMAPLLLGLGAIVGVMWLVNR